MVISSVGRFPGMADQARQIEWRRGWGRVSASSNRRCWSRVPVKDKMDSAQEEELEMLWGSVQ